MATARPPQRRHAPHNFEKENGANFLASQRSVGGSSSRMRFRTPTQYGSANAAAAGRPRTAGPRPWSPTHADLQMSGAAQLSTRPATAHSAARGLSGSAATRQRSQSARLAQRHRSTPLRTPATGPSLSGAAATVPTPPQRTASPPRRRAARPFTAQTIPFGDIRNTSPTRVTAAALYDEMRVLEDPSKFDSWTWAVQEWEESFAAEVGNYPSVLLYCQMKLKEAFSVRALLRRQSLRQSCARDGLMLLTR
jgi:hypothetical protein